jgi:hypothetical protein
MVANSASRRCCVTVPIEAAAVLPLPEEVIDANELTELFVTCEEKREVTEDIDGLLPCVGVPGVEIGAEAYPVPKRRRVDEKRRDGSRLEEEY